MNFKIYIIILLIIILLFKKKKEHFSGKKQNSIKLNNTLKKITQDIREYNINDWFIAYGTLLGIVRNNSCIKGDDDIDIIINKTESNKLHKLIKDKGYKYDINKSIIRIKINNNYTPIDFYTADKKNNNYKDLWEKVTWSNVNPIIKKKWNNINLNLPKNYETKLENRYGKDWKTPRQWKGPKNKKKIL